MPQVDLEHLRRWVGTSRADEDRIAARHARLMAATVDHVASDRMRDGELLPALWHWIYFADGANARDLGRDGHPARGGFLPPVPLTHRMWAGGRIEFLAPIVIGATVRRKSTVVRVDHKTGRSGELVFVTVLHELESPAGEALLREEHDIVYRDPSSRAASSAANARAAVAAPAVAAAVIAARAPGAPDAGTLSRPASPFARTITPTSTLLFRYSALTFNGHRIHYDADYCRDVEGYPNLVVHGPLIATLLANFAEEASRERLRRFTYRALTPAFLGDAITLHGEAHQRSIVLRATLDDGRACMEAEASLS